MSDSPVPLAGPYTTFTYGDPARLPLTFIWSFQFTAAWSGFILTYVPTWLGIAFPGGYLGIPYTQSFTPGGGTPITVSLTAGALPPGLSLSLVSGSLYQISGTPTALGSYSFTLHAVNAWGSADYSFTIGISAPPAGGGGAWTFVS